MPTVLPAAATMRKYSNFSDGEMRAAIREAGRGEKRLEMINVLAARQSWS